MIEIDPDDNSADDNYRIMISVTTPRPIGWISTIDEDGIPNLAPFSHYNNVCTTRPVVMFAAGDKSDSTLKDTPTNISQTEEFVVNVVTESLAKQMNKTADEIPAGESEFDYAGLTSAESRTVSPPRVAEAIVNLECTLYDVTRIHTSTVIFGSVELIHVSEKILTDGKVDMDKIDTVGRLGGRYFTTLNKMDMTRRYPHRDA